MFYAKYKEEIMGLIKDAMKERNTVVLNTYRGLKNAVDTAAKEKMAELTSDEFDAVVMREVKAYRDTLDAAQKLERYDIIADCTYSLDMLKYFMPDQATEEEIRAYLQRLTVTNIGQAMSAMKLKFDGRADMKVVASIVKEHLQN